MDVPALIPLTLPEPSTAALALLLLHVPPAVISLKAVTDPTHTTAVPVIADGNEFIVTVTLPCVPQHPDADNALK